MKHKAPAIAFGVSMLASMFAPAAMASEATLPITHERYQLMHKCRENTNKALDAMRHRAEPDIEEYYFRDQAVMNAAAVAIATGKHLREQEMVSLLDHHMTLTAFALVAQMDYSCVLFSDEKGNLPHDALAELAGMTRSIDASHDKMMKIIKELKAEGDELIRNGAKVPTDPNVSVFGRSAFQ